MLLRYYTDSILSVPYWLCCFGTALIVLLWPRNTNARYLSHGGDRSNQGHFCVVVVVVAFVVVDVLYKS